MERVRLRASADAPWLPRSKRRFQHFKLDLALTLTRAYLLGEQFTAPKLDLTEKALPEAVYFEQPMPSMQNVSLSQSTENELESKAKAQPVFDVASRTSVSLLPLTTQLSLALLQIAQANCALVPEVPADDPGLSVSTTPPHAPAPTSDNPIQPNPNSHRTTHYA